MLEAGSFDIAVGASSRDLRLTTTINVTAPPVPVRLDAMASLHEWLVDPAGSAALREAIGTHPDGRPRGILGDAHLMSIIGNFPISSLAAFGDLGIDHTTVTELSRRLAR